MNNVYGVILHTFLLPDLSRIPSGKIAFPLVSLAQFAYGTMPANKYKDTEPLACTDET